MQGNVGIRGIGVESLANHHYSFAMRILACANKAQIGGNGNIAGNFLPNELESIRGKPHVLSAAGQGIALLGSVVVHGPGMENRAYVSVPFENTDWLGSWCCAEF